MEKGQKYQYQTLIIVRVPLNPIEHLTCLVIDQVHELAAVNGSRGRSNEGKGVPNAPSNPAPLIVQIFWTLLASIWQWLVG